LTLVAWWLKKDRTRSSVNDANNCRLAKHRKAFTRRISGSNVTLPGGQENGCKKQGNGRNDHKSAHTKHSSEVRIIQRESDGTFVEEAASGILRQGRAHAAKCQHIRVASK